MSDDDVIHRVCANFVPVAVNLYKVRELKDAGGELFRSIQRQKDQFQGIWIVSPEGKVLSGYGDSSHAVFTDGDVDNAKTEAAWIEKIRETIGAALQAFGAVKPRPEHVAQALPDRGVGILPDGGARLALYARYIAYQPLRSDSDNHVRIDSLVLTAEEWAALAPPKVEAGVEWRLPESVARRFARVLCPASDSDGWPLPAEVTSVKLAGKVEKVDNGVATLSFGGDIAGVHVAAGQNASGLSPGTPKPRYGGEARLTGLARYDTTKRGMQTLTFVFEGSYRHRLPADPRPMAAVVEWRRARSSP